MRFEQLATVRAQRHRPPLAVQVVQERWPPAAAAATLGEVARNLVAGEATGRLQKHCCKRFQQQTQTS
jgi:hypothetical protein